METKKKIEELREQISNLDWVMSFILEHAKIDKEKTDAISVLGSLIGLEDTKYELQTLLEEYEYKDKREQEHKATSE